MNNNILITFINAIDPTSGGVERVYHNLAPFFTKRGDKVYAIYKKRSEYDSQSVYTEVFWDDEDGESFEGYYRIIDNVISKHNINVVICPFPSYQLFGYLSCKSSLKVFFHVHNVPSTLMLSSPRAIPSFLKNTIVDRCIRRVRQIVRYESSFRQIERNGMKVVLLSEQFRDDMKKVWHFKDATITSIPNPFCIDMDFKIEKQKKEKVILYVGRLSEKQKRITLLLNIWKKIQDRTPDYRLDIVGGGPDQSMYEQMVIDMQLKRVTFYGFQNPEEYYKKSEIFCMTSYYEGFPMVLVEAMQYGCVPFAFNSFASLTDVIDDGENGIIIPSFDEDEYAERIVKFANMSDAQQLTFRRNAVEKSKTFSVENIGKKWLKLIDNY